MCHPDTEGTDRVRDPMPMTMAFLSLMAMKVDMSLAVMVMAMDMPSFALEASGGRPTETTPEQGDP